MRDDGDNVFVIRCLDSTILDKATEDFTKYKVDHRLTDNDLDSNPMHWFLKAQGGSWVVEPANWNGMAADFFPDQMQPANLQQV